MLRSSGAPMPRRLSPAQILVLGFAGLIAGGALLLSLPWSSASGDSVGLVDAAFTSTSAVCVTGLIVRDTPVEFSLLGQFIIMGLVQAGGLGYMTLSTIFAVLIGKRLTYKERLTLQEALNIDTREGLVRFVLSVARMTLVFEGLGALILAIRWSSELGIGRATYFGVFHAVSAFNNAGFSLFSDNLMGYRGDFTVNLVISTLIICGGLGFFVLREIRSYRSYDRWSLHTKLVLAFTGGLLASGTVLIFLLERWNPRTLGPLGWGEAALAAYFQAVTPRTAGFNTIAIGDMSQAALFVLIVLMFIGASPGSTGGGVKTTTFGVTLMALWATVRGDEEADAFGRRIPAEVVSRAFFISLIAFLWVAMLGLVLLIVEQGDLLPTLFETTSAFGTVGLSMGRPGSVLSLAGHYSEAGKLLLALMMYLGRVGPLTVAIALAARRARPRLRHPEGRVFIG